MNSKTPVTFCLPNGFGVGGVETWSVQLSRVLAEFGYDTRLLIHRNCGHPAPPPKQDRVDFRYVRENHRIPAVPRSVLENYVSTLPSIFIPNWDPHVYAATAKLANKCPDKVRVLGFCHADEIYYYELLRYYEPVIHKFVAVSQRCLDALQEIIPHRQDDISFKPYPVIKPQSQLLNLDNDPHPVRIIYAGRIQQAQKRIFDLYFLAKDLLEMKVPFRLYVVGDGPDKSELARMFESLEKQDQACIELLPPKSHEALLELLMDMDVAVLTSEYEGTSIFMLESMAYACVPIVTNVSGTDMINDGYNGFKVEVGDHLGMATHIRHIQSDPGCLNEMKRNACNTVDAYSMEEYLSWFDRLSCEVWDANPRKWPLLRRYVRPDPVPEADRALVQLRKPAAMIRRLLPLSLLSNTKRQLKQLF